VGVDTKAGLVTVAQAPPRLIDRAGLLAVLDRAAARKVAIISAPAGSGKTSLLRAWAERPGQQRRLAFVQVRRDQVDAQDFWLALLAAVHRASRAAGGEEPPAAMPGFNAAAMADRVLSELAAAPGGITLVIEDLHELNSPESLDQLVRVLRRLPAGTHAVLSTRHDLRLRLHQLRLAGELAEVRAADLCFSAGETRRLLDVSGIALSQAGTVLLHQRTEGWAAGLRLAVLSLAGHPDPERFVAEFSGTDRTVAEYLLAEMLDRQPREVQDLLLRTCLLDRVNGELADLLAGRPGSERILLGLEDANAFVVSLDPERTWFRYHHLFADLLRLELRRTLPEEVPALHRRAAGWFTGHGLFADAIRHTQAAGDWPDAARLLADHSFGLTMDGQAHTVRALLRAFPPGADYPELALMHAGDNLARGRLDETAAHLTVVEAYAGTATPERQHRLRVAIASLRLSLAARRGDLDGVVEQARFLDSPVTGQSDEDIALDSDLRAVALLNLGTVEAALGLPGAERHLREGAALSRKIGRPYLEVSCLAQLGFASRTRSLGTAQQRCREAIALAGRYGWGAEWFIAPALITLAGTLAWTGEFDECERWLRRTKQILETGAGPDTGLLVDMVSGMLLAGRGRHREALDEFSAAERLQSRLEARHTLANQVTGWTLTAQVRAGMLAEARAGLAELDDDRGKAGELANARAVLRLAEGDPAGVLDALRPVLDGTAPVVFYATVVEAQLLAAFAHRDLGDQRAANEAAENALTLAEPDRLVLPFAMTGSLELLEALPRHETAHVALLTDILDIMRATSAVLAGHPAPPAQELSPSELRVLRYLPTNLSRPEIADELSISLNTVGTHLRRIYAKLGADDRSTAVQRARELRLLSADRTGSASWSPE
jgi:LuxR family maltose regulon positive regulatory protein